VTLVGELKRRGVFGALIAYGVAAAGLLQLLDIVSHALEAPQWTMKLIVWLAAAGLPVTLVVSWFWDLTRHGFVRTQAPPARVPDPPEASQPLSPAGPAIAPGSVLAGRYRLERELGSGGMGQVFAAVDAKLGRRVAVKVVTLAHDPGRVRRFEQEARTAGALEHPNLLSVYDLGEEQGVPFLVTELLEGHTLRTLVARGPLLPDQVTGLALQLARGLGAAHARGVVHRDLKPENVFVTTDGRLKILDFGLAKLTSPSDDAGGGPGLTATGAVFGTAGYLSPEQARGERAGPPSDVFAAGAVLYELLTGRRAFPGETLVEAAHAAMKSEPPPLPGEVPQELASIVLRCLAKEPTRRYQDGGELARAIEAQPIAASVRPVDVARPRRRGPAGLYAAGAALAVGAAAISAVLVDRRAAKKDPAIPPLPAPFDSSAVPLVPKQALRAGEQGILAGVRALLRSEHPAEAERLLRRALADRPDFVDGHLELFALLRRLGRRSEADKYIREAASRYHEPGFRGRLLQVYAGRGSEDDALAAAGSDEEDEEDADSQIAEAAYYLGLLRMTDPVPDRERARKYFEQSLEKDPDGPLSGFAREEEASLDQPMAGSGLRGR
jgi:tetratricopeptide (TPR) repeat protein